MRLIALAGRDREDAPVVAKGRRAAVDRHLGHVEPGTASRSIAAAVGSTRRTSRTAVRAGSFLGDVEDDVERQVLDDHERQIALEMARASEGKREGAGRGLLYESGGCAAATRRLRCR